jgi:hypothetical protein
VIYREIFWLSGFPDYLLMALLGQRIKISAVMASRKEKALATV